jgi:hypothetical protein
MPAWKRCVAGLEGQGSRQNSTVFGETLTILGIRATKFVIRRWAAAKAGKAPDKPSDEKKSLPAFPRAGIRVGLRAGGGQPGTT